MRLGSYTITGQLGGGAMGEVWRATDTGLGRHVAIKVLPEAFARDRAARTIRARGQMLASISHPNIPASPAVVMELVEGMTLADRIAQVRCRSKKRSLSPGRSLKPLRLVSTAGGVYPRWSGDGKELFYIAPDGRLMAVPIAAGEARWNSGAPAALFQTRRVGGGMHIVGRTH